MKAAWIAVAVAVLSFGQTTAKKESAPTTKKATVPAAKSDTWQRSKECASQAEKFVAGQQSTGILHYESYNNHYSPKYGKCFVLMLYSTTKDEIGESPAWSIRVPKLQNVLYDAFERSSPLATYSVSPLTCYTDGKPSDCSEIVKSIWCAIDENAVECAKADSFISGNMKN